MSENIAIPAISWGSPIGVFDLETTGIDVATDRIVTAHVGVLDANGAVLESHNWLANPGIPIPEQATAVHGISNERARLHGHLASAVVREVTEALRQLFAQGIPVVAFNANYDFSLLLAECRRHGIEPIDNPTPVLDPLVMDKALDRYRRGKRRLTDVAEHYGVELENAHDASADARAAGRVAQAIARIYAHLMPETMRELHARQVGWARSQAASLTDYFIRIGRLDADDELDGSWPVRSSVATD
ncbi:3'-5' exonuclease [Microbacterium sp. NC79]|uniref:3'-5' exonuclease n=1 Tax=Microbacterium sp. NC79 TaxID=2851009 RepID=UPI001C2BFAAE|nr:3'-5' exonuclease [Microbacterium sp. NC79]MBV0894846.1 3'-5' exonuclease [Microbacterium sp. NC79]